MSCLKWLRNRIKRGLPVTPPTNGSRDDIELTPTAEVAVIVPSPTTIFIPGTKRIAEPHKFMVSKHFSLEEVFASQTADRKGIDNYPYSDELIENAKYLAETLLEPLREEFGPVYGSSWYRCAELNSALGGSSATSLHLRALALDHRTNESMFDEMEWWKASKLPYEEAIYEFGGWIHVAVSPKGTAPKHELFMKLWAEPALTEAEAKVRKRKQTRYLPYDRKQIDPTGKMLVA